MQICERVHKTDCAQCEISRKSPRFLDLQGKREYGYVSGNSLHHKLIVLLMEVKRECL